MFPLVAVRLFKALKSVGLIWNYPGWLWDKRIFNWMFKFNSVQLLSCCIFVAFVALLIELILKGFTLEHRARILCRYPLLKIHIFSHFFWKDFKKWNGIYFSLSNRWLSPIVLNFLVILEALSKPIWSGLLNQKLFYHRLVYRVFSFSNTSCSFCHHNESNAAVMWKSQIVWSSTAGGIRAINSLRQTSTHIW